MTYLGLTSAQQAYATTSSLDVQYAARAQWQQKPFEPFAFMPEPLRSIQTALHAAKREEKRLLAAREALRAP